MAEADRGRYQSEIFAGVRFVSQELLLRPFIWRILKVNIHGLANIEPLEAPFVVVANHSSHLDAPLVVGALPRRLTKFLATGAAADYFYASKIKSISTALVANTYPIERRGLRTRKGLSKQLLADGVPLLIFPEGTRSRTGAMGPFTPGVAALCISDNAPCVPIALVGAYAAWPYGQGHLPRGRPEVHVVIGHPLTPAPGEIARQFSERMRRTVQQLHDSTARAYGLPTLDDYARAVSLRQASVPSAVSPVTPPHASDNDGGTPAGKDHR